MKEIRYFEAKIGSLIGEDLLTITREVYTLGRLYDGLSFSMDRGYLAFFSRSNCLNNAWQIESRRGYGQFINRKYVYYTIGHRKADREQFVEHLQLYYEDDLTMLLFNPEILDGDLTADLSAWD